MVTDEQEAPHEIDGQKVIWQPQPGAQEAFMSATSVFEVLIEGNRGGGKTDCLLMSYCMQVGKGFGEAWNGILFRETFPQLQDVIKKSKKWIPQIWPQAVYNNTNSFWRWPSGEKLSFKQFNKDDDYWNYHGHEYPFIAWEELCNWKTDEGYKRMMSLCRSSFTPKPGEPDMPRMIRATANPYGPGHTWVKQRFKPTVMDRIVRTDIIEDDIKQSPRLVIKSDLEENKVLLASDPEYKQKIAMAAKNTAEKKAWLSGDWDVVAGGMFDDVWDRNYNVIEPFNIPDNWRIVRSFDWGASRPFSVGWWAVSNGEDVTLFDGKVLSTVKGDIFRIKEWYGTTGKPNEGIDMLASEISAGIVARELQWGWRRDKWCRVKGGVADAQIFAAENGNCIAVDMAKSVRLDNGMKYKGIQWEPSDKRAGSRVTGWNQMRQMLRAAWPNKRENGKMYPREKPGMFIFSNCLHFIELVPVLPRDEKNMDDVNSETEDHIADEARYFVRYVGLQGSTGKVRGVF